MHRSSYVSTERSRGSSRIVTLVPARNATSRDINGGFQRPPLPLRRTGLVQFLRLTRFSATSNFWVTNCCCTPVDARRWGVARNKNGRGGRGGCFPAATYTPIRPYTFRPPLRHSGALLCAEMRRLSREDASGKGSRASEKVDQYQAKRSAPTNLCGDPSNDTSRSLQPSRFCEHTPWKTAVLVLSSTGTACLPYFIWISCFITIIYFARTEVWYFSPLLRACVLARVFQSNRHNFIRYRIKCNSSCNTTAWKCKEKS